MLLTLLCFTTLNTSSAHATDPTSTNYHFSESTLGAGGLPLSNSANFQGSSSTGDLGVGESASANYGFQGGSQTTNDPTLSFAINTGIASFGNFSPSIPAMTTTTFSVLNYTSYGYAVYVTGNTPTNDGHALPPMATHGTNDTSQIGFEQFGMNLVANTSPQSIGANPDNTSGGGGFSFGQAWGDYLTSNKYWYGDGDIIAKGLKSSGVTNYTISYLVNVAALTPGGQYNTNQTLIVVGTY